MTNSLNLTRSPLYSLRLIFAFRELLHLSISIVEFYISNGKLHILHPLVNKFFGINGTIYILSPKIYLLQSQGLENGLEKWFDG